MVNLIDWAKKGVEAVGDTIEDGMQGARKQVRLTKMLHQSPVVKDFMTASAALHVAETQNLVLMAYRSVHVDTLKQLLALLEPTLVRYKVTGGDMKKLGRICDAVAADIYDRRVKTFDEITNLLKPLLVTDTKFKRDFQSLNFAVDKMGDRYALFVLTALESQTQSAKVESDDATLDRIQLLGPGKTFYRLGNMALLENSLCGDNEYVKKVVAYAKSSFLTTQEIAKKGASDWTEAEMEAREKELAKRAVKIWPRA